MHQEQTYLLTGLISRQWKSFCRFWRKGEAESLGYLSATAPPQKDQIAIRMGYQNLTW